MSIVTEMYQGRVRCTFNEKAHTYHFRVAGVCEKRWLPSITGILAMKAKPALLGWSAKQSLKVVQRRLGEFQSQNGELVAIPPQELESWIHDATENWREEDDSCTIGSIVHRFAFEELRFRAGFTPAKPRFPIEADPVLMPNFTSAMVEATNAAASQAVKFMDEHDIRPILLERPLLMPQEGWCGTPDFYGYIDGDLCVADWKTSRRIYTEYYCQLAALQAAVENEFGQKVKKRWAVNIPKDGSDLQAEFRDSDELYEQDLRMFRACFELYKWTRANDPFAAGNPVEPIGSLEPAQLPKELVSDCPF